MTEADEKKNDSDLAEGDSPEARYVDPAQVGEKVGTDTEVKQSLGEGKAKSPKKKANKIYWAVVFFTLALLFVSVAGGGFYLFWQQSQKVNKKALQEIQTLQQQVAQSQIALTQLQQYQQTFADKIRESEADFSKRVLVNEQRIQAQHKKLQGLSTTSREDWLLAEAEYLLRLANQRVLIERSPKNADALLSEADEILKNLDDPDLFSLRQAIANDLAQLRLVQEIDHEGLYFSLNALARQVEGLDIRPSRQERFSVPDAPEVEVQNSAASAPTAREEQSFWKTISNGFKGTFSVLNEYIRFQNHSVPPPPLLSPDSASYLKQNLRLKIERAQLALLREEQKIFTSSLDEAIEWLERYYPKSSAQSTVVGQLQTLRKKNIVQTLPDITFSLALLHQYIETLHQLDGVKPKQNAGETLRQLKGDAL